MRDTRVCVSLLLGTVAAEADCRCLGVVAACFSAVFDCFRFTELAEIGRCRASVSPPQGPHGQKTTNWGWPPTPGDGRNHLGMATHTWGWQVYTWGWPPTPGDGGFAPGDGHARLGMAGSRVGMGQRKRTTIRKIFPLKRTSVMSQPPSRHDGRPPSESSSSATRRSLAPQRAGASAPMYFAPPRPCKTILRPRCSAAAGSAAPTMSVAFVGSATRERERERAITTVSSSSARVEMPPGAGPAGAVLNATVGSLAGAVMNATPPRFGHSERRTGASNDTSWDHRFFFTQGDKRHRCACGVSSTAFKAHRRPHKHSSPGVPRIRHSFYRNARNTTGRFCPPFPASGQIKNPQQHGTRHGSTAPIRHRWAQCARPVLGRASRRPLSVLFEQQTADSRQQTAHGCADDSSSDARSPLAYTPRGYWPSCALLNMGRPMIERRFSLVLFVTSAVRQGLS